MEREMSNEDLAAAYFRVVSAEAGSFDTYSGISKKIEGAEIDISRVYVENGNLASLNIGGIGVKTKKVLEGILEEGEKNTKDSLSEDRIKRDKDSKISKRHRGRKANRPERRGLGGRITKKF